MMSLFSSFDLFFFKFCFLLSGIFLLFSGYCMSFFNMKIYVLVLISEKINSFFSSLKFSGISKFMFLLFFSFFFMIFTLNISSIFSFNFSLTTQINLILMISFCCWLSFIILSLIYNFKKWMAHCIPEGSPMSLSFALFLIELVSNFIRPITVTVRLCANILAGHLLMILMSKLIFLNNFSMPMFFCLNLVEFFVSLIQSYIYCTMICLYYSDLN